MKRLFIIALLLLGCVDSALGQTTTVTGTITDAQGNAYANGTASAIKVVATGLSPGTPITVPTSATGFFTFSGSTNALPSPASYQFTVCATPVLLGQPTVNPTPRQICFTSGPIAISGASQDISSTLNAIAPTLGPQGQGANPTFINPTVTGTLTVPAPSNCANSVATGLNTTLGANCTNSTGTGAWTVGGNTTTATLNGTIVIPGTNGLTLQQAINSCPTGILGCEIKVTSNLTVNSVITASQAGSPIHISCLGNSAVNGNLGGTLITFTPAAASNFFVATNQTRVIIENCNFTQSNALLPASAALTNITWSGTTATANCTATCSQFSVGQVVNITGNATINATLTNYPVTVTAITSNSFSFIYPNSSTGAGGTAQPLVDAFQMSGSQGFRFINSQISGFPGVGVHIVDINGSSSAEYSVADNTHISQNGVGVALTVVPPNGTQSANAHVLLDSVVGGNSIIDIMTTGGASELTVIGGEISDGGKNKQVMNRFGDGGSSCRGPYFMGVTMESTGGGLPAGQIGIDNRCQGADIHWEGGLGIASAQLIVDGTGPGGICHWAWRTGASTSANEPSTPFSESTCPGLRWDSAGDISLNGAAVIGGGGNITGVAALYTGGNNTWLFSSTLIASGAPITAVYPSSATTSLGKTGSGAWTNLLLGTAATNNFNFTPAATSAQRTVSIPDPGTNVNLAFNLTATSSAFATATTAGTCVQNTTSVTGATTSMVATASPVSTPGVGAVWSAFVSSTGNVTINECAVATSAGGTIAFNIRVTP